MTTSTGYVGWIDLTDGDIRRAKKVIAGFTQDDSVDALGFQPISDVFSDRFYPAVTTPMTRARYYIFIPAIYRVLERDGEGRAGIVTAAENIQTDLMRILLKRERGNGVIGQRSGDDLERFPAAIYWSALRKLGILTNDISEHEYQREISVRENADELLVTDDQTEIRGEMVEDFWDDVPVDRVLSRYQLRHGLTFCLTREEANYLNGRVQHLARNSFPSVFSERLVAGDERMLRHPWEWKARSRDLAGYLSHAGPFSAMTRALSLIYEDLVALAKKRAASATRRQISESFNEWGIAGPHWVRRWDIGEFFNLFQIPEGSDREVFVTFAKKCRAQKNISRLFYDPELRDLVKARESQQRPNKCRLCGKSSHAAYLKDWRRPKTSKGKTTFHLDYRHNPGQTIVRDILRLPYE
jgi:hypothetical protein